MSAGRIGIGVIGAGVISSYYLENLTRFPELDVAAVADVDDERARARAVEFELSAVSAQELLASDEIEIVLNLTTPAAHLEVSTQILASGKHVWSEKPLAPTRDEAQTLLNEAGRAGLRVACAPDTFLGGVLQTAQRMVDAGRIGDPKSAVAIMQSPGPEHVHAGPAFFYDIGGGPLLDMGPYYVTALVQTMGPIRQVSALSSTAVPTRRVIVGSEAGTTFDVRVPTQFMALLEFESGAIGTLLSSFDSAVRRDLLELSGTEATLQIPNPSRFDGSNMLVPLRSEPEVVPTVGTTWGRGVGVVDLARSLREGGAERASGALGYHVLDVLLAVAEAAITGAPVTVESTVPSPCPLPETWDPRTPGGKAGRG
jgi:predicted dehydrogenase